MGEIATWSAVKTKVGLGKDSNECPTKAELLALSPTGTGENYVGLELTNASSYGNNETVQLSDIHKVTYKYSFAAVNTSLNFPALGGKPTPEFISIGSTRQKYLDGVASGSPENISYNISSTVPDWLNVNNGTWTATENTALSQRSTNVIFTQVLSGKTVTVSMVQAAGVETWEYNFSVEKSSLSFSALGGVSTTGDGYINILSNKQRYINGKVSGSPVTVTYSSNDLPDWLSYQTEPNNSVKAVATENKSESSRSFTRTVTQAESGKKVTITYNQVAGVKTYGTPTVYLGSIADIPASGGTAATPTYTYSQLWGWNGKTNDGGTISSGASVVWSENISGSNLGTTVKARTKLGSRTLTVTLNGKSGSASINVYQAENKIESVTQGGWIVSISANPSTFTEQGGTSQISASARASRTNHWTSGATSAASDATGTPTLSIPTAVTGFSLSGTTLTVAENTTANQRSVVIRATMDTVYKEVTVTQSAYLVEWRYTLTTSTPTLNFDALGTTKEGTLTSYREKYINGSLVEGSRENVNATYKSGSAEIQSATQTVAQKVAITMKENTTAKARTGTVVYEQFASGKTITITCNQAAATITTRDVLEITTSLNASMPALGGDDYGIVKSGYYDVINGADSTWHPVAPTLKSKSSYITKAEITKTTEDRYRIDITLSENTSESSRRASITLTYGSKELDMATTQEGASVSSRLVITFDTNQPDSWEAGPAGQQYKPLKVKCYRENIVNGSVNSTTALQPVVTKSGNHNYPTFGPATIVQLMSGSPKGTVWEYQVDIEDNDTEEQRGGTIRFTHPEDGTKFVEFEITQAAAVITYNYILSVSPSVLNFNAGFTTSSIEITSYREKLANGSVIDEENVTPNIGFLWDDPQQKNWLSYYGDGEANSSHIYTRYIECQENQEAATRSATIDIYQTDGKSDDVQVTQKAATISTRYDIFWRLSDADGNTDRVTEVELNGSSGSGTIDMIVIMNKITTINGNETSTPIGTYTEQNALRLSGGNVNVQLGSYNRDQISGVFDLGFQLGVSQDNLEATAYTVSASLIAGIKDGNTEVGTAPNFIIKVLPVPYTRVFEFSWKQEGSTITNITLDGDISSSGSVASRDIISYESLRRNGVEFAKKYIQPTLIPVSVDWVRVIDNQQSSDNSYNWAIQALSNNEGDSARTVSVRFEQPGNGNQSLYMYISQSPKSVPAFLNAYLYNTYNATNNLQTRISWQGSTEEDGQIGDNLVISKGGYLGAYTGLNDGNLYVQFKGKPGAGINSSMYVSLQNLHIESGNEHEGTLKKTPLTIGPSGGSYNIEWGSFSIDNDAFTCRISDYGLNTEGGFIYFVVEKANTSVQVLEGAQIGSIPLHLKSNVEGFDGMFGTINIDFFYGMP